MSRWGEIGLGFVWERARPRSLLLLCLAWFCSDAYAFEGIGRPATEAEIRAWDIDVRPDFAGLPPGKGSVADGEAVWIEKCTACHGDFGDSSHVFQALIGNTTPEDIESGRVAALTDPGRTRSMMMKLATLSTLWDYINRAMPWDHPKSLSTDEVYAVTAYLLNLADIVPADHVLSNENIAAAQTRMPNRDGMTEDHGLWKVDGKPDTHNRACMHDCLEKPVTVLSSLPDFALGAHGELQQQMREYGSIRGTRTLAKEDVIAPTTGASQVPQAQLAANNCLVCHGMESKLVGPGFAQIAEKYRERKDAVDYLKSRVRGGSSGIWGDVPMPAAAQISDADLDSIARWLDAGAPH